MTARQGRTYTLDAIMDMMVDSSMVTSLDLHVSLPIGLARALSEFARARGLKRAQALRLAVESLLEQAERETRDAEMREYVARMAPHSREFVRQSSSEVSRRLLEETEW